MKVLHVIGHLNNGGAEVLLTESLQYYTTLSINVEILVLSGRNPLLLELIQEKEKVTFLSKYSVYNVFLFLLLIPKIKKYDIIHVHLFPSLYHVGLANMLLRKRKKLFYTEHSTHNRRRDNIFLKLIDKLVYGFYDRIICVSSAVKYNLINHLGKDTKKIITINNGINLEKFRLSKSKNFKFFAKKSFVIMQISRFSTSKDHKTLIKSLLFLPEEIKLILVGDGVLKEQFKSLVDELNLARRVIFLGNRSDVPELIKYASVIVQSSFYEGFGLSALEGMASRKPVVATNIPGLSKLINNPDLLFEPKDHKKLAAIIKKLWSDPIYYNLCASKCYKESENYSIQKMIKSYIKEYNKFST